MVIAERWIKQGYQVGLVLHSVGLKPSTYYEYKSRTNDKHTTVKVDVTNVIGPGRPILGYSFTYEGKKVPDELIEKHIMNEISGDGYPYGYKKLTSVLQEDYGLDINHKKVYRLCKKLDVLLPQRVITPKYPRKLAKKTEVTGPNRLWQMDIKYGYIAGIDRFFFIMSIIDVYDRMIVAYHIGLRALAEDAVRILKQAIISRGVTKDDGLVLRTDNGPQFVANRFQDVCAELPVTHTRIPVNTPNLNAFIESFHAILESDCLSRHEFAFYAQAYKKVSEFMDYYNNRRRHGSLGNKPPRRFYEELLSRDQKLVLMIA